MNSLERSTCLKTLFGPLNKLVSVLTSNEKIQLTDSYDSIYTVIKHLIHNAEDCKRKLDEEIESSNEVRSAGDLRISFQVSHDELIDLKKILLSQKHITTNTPPRILQSFGEAYAVCLNSLYEIQNLCLALHPSDDSFIINFSYFLETVVKCLEGIVEEIGLIDKMVQDSRNSLSDESTDATREQARQENTAKEESLPVENENENVTDLGELRKESVSALIVENAPLVVTTVQTIVDEMIEVSEHETESLLLIESIDKQTIDPKIAKPFEDSQASEPVIRPIIIEKCITYEDPISFEQECLMNSLTILPLLHKPLLELEKSISLIVEEQHVLEGLSDEKDVANKILCDEIVEHLVELQTSIAATQQYCCLSTEEVNEISLAEETYPALRNLAESLDILEDHLHAVASEQIAHGEVVETTDSWKENNINTTVLEILSAPIHNLKQFLSVAVEECQFIEPYPTTDDDLTLEEEVVNSSITPSVKDSAIKSEPKVFKMDRLYDNKSDSSENLRQAVEPNKHEIVGNAREVIRKKKENVLKQSLLRETNRPHEEPKQDYEHCDRAIMRHPMYDSVEVLPLIRTTAEMDHKTPSTENDDSFDSHYDRSLFHKNDRQKLRTTAYSKKDSQMRYSPSANLNLLTISTFNDSKKFKSAESLLDRGTPELRKSKYYYQYPSRCYLSTADDFVSKKSSRLNRSLDTLSCLKLKSLSLDPLSRSYIVRDSSRLNTPVRDLKRFQSVESILEPRIISTYRSRTPIDSHLNLSTYQLSRLSAPCENLRIDRRLYRSVHNLPSTSSSNLYLSPLYYSQHDLKKYKSAESMIDKTKLKLRDHGSSNEINRLHPSLYSSKRTISVLPHSVRSKSYLTLHVEEPERYSYSRCSNALVGYTPKTSSKSLDYNLRLNYDSYYLPRIYDSSIYDTYMRPTYRRKPISFTNYEDLYSSSRRHALSSQVFFFKSYNDSNCQFII